MKNINVIKILFGYLLIIGYFYLYKGIYQNIIQDLPTLGTFELLFRDMTAGLILVLAGIIFGSGELSFERNTKIEINYFNLLIYTIPAIYLYIIKFNVGMFFPFNFIFDYLDELTTIGVFLIGLGIGKSIKVVKQ